MSYVVLTSSNVAACDFGKFFVDCCGRCCFAPPCVAVLVWAILIPGWYEFIAVVHNP